MSKTLNTIKQQVKYLNHDGLNNVQSVRRRVATRLQHRLDVFNYKYRNSRRELIVMVVNNKVKIQVTNLLNN